MNPLRGQQRNLDPTHQSIVNTSMGSASRTNNKWDAYCEYSRFTADEPDSSIGMKVGWGGLSPLPHTWHSEEPAAEDPDGKPLEMDEEDPELARKRKELKAIEEQIMLKKAAIALKTVEPFVKKIMSPGLSCDEQSAACEGTTLRDRVNGILQRRHPLSSESKVQLLKYRISSFSLRKDDHPLKVRVNSIMRRRCPDPCVVPTNSEVLDVMPPPPPIQAINSPPEEENSVNKGFLRFLNVLNEGVDMDFLSRIVNDDSEDLPLGGEILNMKPPAVESNSDAAFTSENQTPSSGDNPLRRSRPNSGERKTISQEGSHSERHSLPDDEEKTNERGGHSLGSRSRSKSPPAKIKKKKKEKEEKTKLDEQQEQLQNILKTLGFSLEADEMSRLADRTQERLYGKQPRDKQRPDRGGEKDGQDRDSHRHDRHSSPSSSCSSSSSYSSRSFSSSPSPRRRSRSHSTDSRDSHQRKQTSNKDSNVQDVNQDNKETHIHQTYPSPPQPTTFSQHYSLAQCSQYAAYHNGMYTTPTNSYYTYAQGATPSVPSLNGFTYPQNTFQHSPGPVAAPNKPNKHHHKHDKWAHMNPDLSMSEGQTGLTKGPRCLKLVISSGKKPVKKQRSRRRFKRNKRKRQKQLEKIAKKVEAEQRALALEFEEEIKPLPGEDFKVYLRRKLDVFHQKKTKASQLHDLADQLKSETAENVNT